LRTPQVRREGRNPARRAGAIVRAAWGGRPHHGYVPEESPRPVYVALGDSISIDDYAGGRGCGGPGLLFANRADDFPQWRGHDLVSDHPDATLALLATDGATTRTLLDVQLPRLAALRLHPTIVTVTIGGNDVLSAYGNTPAARESIREVARALSQALRHLQPAVAAGGRVIVGTVYDPSDGTGDTGSLGLPAWPDAVGVIDELNAALRDVALQHGAAVAEIGRHFHGHGLLAGDPAQALARPANRMLWFCNVIEPNAWGGNGVREALWAAMQ
jgi:lysophospholipase L1-like esterase